MLNNIVLFVVSFFVLSPTLAAEAFQAKGAIASFYAVTQSGCITNHRFMFAASESSRSGGTGDMRDSVYITEYDYDVCRSLVVANATGYKSLTKQEFDIRNSYAHVTTTIEMVDIDRGMSEYRQVDLIWQGVGNATSGTSNSVYEGSGFKVLTRYSGSTEQATVSGYIGTRPINTAGGLDFTRTGTVTIEKK